jgi:hypothetical protein
MKQNDQSWRAMQRTDKLLEFWRTASSHRNCHRCPRTEQFLLSLAAKFTLELFWHPLPYVQLQDRTNWTVICPQKPWPAGVKWTNKPTMPLRFALLYTIYLPNTTTPWIVLPNQAASLLLAYHINSRGNTGYKQSMQAKGWRRSLNIDQNKSIRGWASAAQEAWIKIIKRKFCASQHYLINYFVWGTPSLHNFLKFWHSSARKSL